MKKGERLHINGIVQGVGFRPTVWRLATELQLTGQVRNSSAGVIIDLWGEKTRHDHFLQRLQQEKPLLARIDRIERTPLQFADTKYLSPIHAEQHFIIADSEPGEVATGIAADASVCQFCLAETLDPNNRRYRYPFTNCTYCGPRLSIVTGIPYDRHHTTMQPFTLCESCNKEYTNPADRRYHAQPIACPACGPKIWLQASSMHVQAEGSETLLPSLESNAQTDVISQATGLLHQGYILAIKGIGGFHLVCDASRSETLKKLRLRKQRPAKPFAVMAENIAMVRQYCRVSEQEAELLQSPQAPIVLLSRLPVSHETTGNESSMALLPEPLAPGVNTLGFMLPNSPLHVLLLKAFNGPLVFTSGNAHGNPQVIDNTQACDSLAAIADFFLLHDRDIVQRLDDSVVRVMANKPQLLRRARGYAPHSLPLPPGFEKATRLLALGGELKNTFCLLHQGEAILSPYIGDLENVATMQDYCHTLDRFQSLWGTRPDRLVIDRHPEYLSAKLGKTWVSEKNLLLDDVQHHHAHIAACMADNGLPLNHPPVLGVVFDGLGWGDDGTLWGGEFLRVDYRQYRRLAHLHQAPLYGGTQAMREPWRNAFAQLETTAGWSYYEKEFSGLDCIRFLQQQPVKTLQGMYKNGINSPLASSCGRLFDAVAALLGICTGVISYEGQAAIELEALCCEKELQHIDGAEQGYLLSVAETHGMLQLQTQPLWQALLTDLQKNIAKPTIAMRFHLGLANSVVNMIEQLQPYFSEKPVVALSGGVFQNRVLIELVKTKLQTKNYSVICHRHVPANDGGLSLGQAVVAVANGVCSAEK